MEIILFDAIFLLFSFVSLTVILVYLKTRTPLFSVKTQLITVFMLHVVYSFLLLSQWAGIRTTSLEKFEDLSGVLIPIAWLFLFYIYSHNMDKLKIRTSEERLALALKGAKSGIWDWNLETGEVFFDPNLYRIAGYEVNEFPNSIDGWKSIVHPDDIKPIEIKRQKYLAGELNEYVVEFRIRVKSGEWMWVRGQGEITAFDSKGQPVRFAGIYIDITDRKLAEAETKASERFLNSVVENIPDMIFVKDAKELSFLRLNKAGEKLLGYTKEELIGKNDYDFFPEEEADFFTKNDRSVLESGELFEIPEEHILTKNSGTRILKTKKISIPDEEGRPEYLLGISEDITEFKKLEQKYRQAQKMEAIGTLAGGIAHDFNNILGSIIGYSEMLKEDLKENESATEFLEQVLIGGSRAEKLVRQILLFSRQSENEKVPVKVIPLLKEVVKMLRASLPSTIDIRLQINTEDASVLGDPTQIHQVLMNLSTNSAHAMRGNGGTLTIEIDQKEIDADDEKNFPNQKIGSYLKIMVSDTGHGMPPDVISRIFDPFFTTKPRGEGTGLGLSVAHGIIKDYGGDIKVYSELEEGTTFSVFLPLADEEEQKDARETTPILKGKEHILFVDDEETLVDLGKIMLERLGYKVTAVSDSQTAWQIFKNDPEAIDIIITDRTMPGLTGLELTRKVVELCPEKPVVMCTGFSTEYSMEELREMGIRDCIYKPILKKELSETIRNILDQAAREEA